MVVYVNKHVVVLRREIDNGVRKAS